MARARSAGRGSRLRKTWQAIPVADNAIASTTQQAIGSITIAEGSALEATILRSRGELLITATPDAGGDSDVLGLGIVVVRANALAVAGVALPGPIADQGSDSWLWHAYIPLDAFGAANEAAAQLVNSCQTRVMIDSKAMRKLPEDSAVVLMFELLTGDFAVVNVSGGCRFLLGT